MRRSVARSLAAFVVVSLLGWSVGRSASAPIDSPRPRPSLTSVALSPRLLHSIIRPRTTPSAFLSDAQDIVTPPTNAAVTLFAKSSSAPTQYPVNVSVDLIGDGTEFSTGVTTANFGPGISVGGGRLGEAGFVEVNGPTSATAQISIDTSAAPGPRAVIVKAGGKESIATFVVPANSSVPVAHAEVRGFVQVGQAVYLDGTGSTLAGAPRDQLTTSGPAGQLKYRWMLVAAPVGSLASLTNVDSAQASLVPDRQGEYAVQLTVGDGVSSTSTWAVFSTDNTAPVAHAGPNQFVALGDLLHLDGSGSTDVDGDSLTYQWTLVSAPIGSAAALSNTSAVSPTLTVDVDGDYEFRLDVNDGHSHTSSDTVSVSTQRSSPIADAGQAQRVALNESVELDGSASTGPDGKPIKCAWSLLSKPFSSSADLSDTGPSACTKKPSFAIDQPGLYVAQLVVSNSDGLQSVATTSASTDQLPPLANPGPPIPVNVGDAVPLDGSSSYDSGGAPLTYFWSILSRPLNSTAILSDTVSASPVFVADQEGDYVAQLVVSNGTFASSPKTVLISAQSPRLQVPRTSASPLDAGSFTPSRPPRPARSPGMQISPSSISFDDQLVGTTSSGATVSITNGENTPLSISNVQLIGANPSDFAIAPGATTFTVPALGSASVTLTFSPSAMGARSGALRITDDSGQHDVALYGNAIAPQVNLVPDAVAMGKQLVSTPTPPVPVKIANTGSAPLVINSLSVTGASSSDFFLNSAATPFTLQPQQSTTIAVTFKPSTATDESATLMIADNTPEGSHSASLSGTGIAPLISVAPGTLAFGNQPNGTPSNPATLSINNPGTADLVISALSISGLNASDFAPSTPPTFPLTVKPGQNASVGFVFTPGSTGSRTASIAITHNAAGSPLNIGLSGVGTAPGITSNPSAVSFGEQLVGIQSAAQTLTVTNSGTASLIVSGLTLAGTNSADFSLAPGFTPPTHGTPITVAPGDTTTIPLTFTPSAEGLRSATLAISGNVSANVVLSGNGTAPHLGLSTTSVSFGNQQVDSTSAPTTITLTNTGTGPLTLTNVSLAGSNAGDFVAGSVATPLVIAPNGMTTLTVAFKPVELGPLSAQLSIGSSASDSPGTISLVGTGIGVPPQITPTSINFNDQLVGTTSIGSVVIINNPHSTPLSVSNVQLLGQNPGDFGFTPATTTFTVPAQGSASLYLKFSPSTTGARSAIFRITDNTGSTDITLSGNGTAPAISVAPTSLAFGNQLSGTAGNPTTLTINNPGTADLLISSFSISGTNAGDFALSSPPTLPLTVKPAQNATIAFVFTPASTGNRIASLAIAHNAGGSPLNVGLSGTGTAPAITPSPSTINFPGQLVNTQSNPQTLTITNSGTASLLISDLTINGANSADFSFTGGFTLPTQANPITVAPGNSTTVPLTFKPQSDGTRSAVLSISGNASANVTITGIGTVPTLSVTPTSLGFGNQLKGSTSAPKTLTITNSGTGDLVISNLLISGSNATDFTFSAAPSYPITIAAGTNGSIALVFTPTTAAPESATLTIASNAPQLTIPLSGTGTVPQITLIPASTLTFGNQLLNTSSAAATVTISNPGTADLHITNIGITGSNAGDFTFSQTPSYPIVVAPNSSTSIGIIFTPTTLARETATLSFTDNVGGSPQMLSLSGTGVAPAIGSLSAVNFGNVNVGSTSSPVILTVTNPGTAPLHITALSFGGTNASDFSTTTTTPLVVDPNNGTVTISLTFSPTAPNQRNAQLTITDDAAGSPHSAALSGVGIGVPKFSVAPGALDFGTIADGTTTAPQPLTITNIGSADLVIDHLIKTGANGGDFFYSVVGTHNNDFPATITPGSTLTVNVFFTPSDPGGTRTATLLFQDAANTSLGSVAVSGIGIAPVPQISLSKTSLAFPPTPTTISSAPLGIVVTNNGTKDLTISALTIAGTNAADFSVAPAAPVVVTKAGGTATIKVTFTPTALGSRSATLAITDDAGNVVHDDTVSLSGTGRDLGRLSLQSATVGKDLELLAIGSVDVAPSADLSITITSSDPTKLLLSPLSTDPAGVNAGVASFIGTLPKGKGIFGNGFPAFWMQALASSGTVQINMTAPGYTSTTATITLAPSGFVLASSLGIGSNFTTQLNAADSNLTVTTAQLDSGNSIVTTDQRVRGGLNVSVDIANGTPAIGTISGTPVSIPSGSGSSTSGTVKFHPVAVGTTLLSIIQPGGYSSPSSGASLTATVQSPSISLTPTIVGYNLEVLGLGTLNIPAPTGGLQITLTSSDPGKVLLSVDPTLLGSAAITVIVPAGSTTIPNYYIQGLAPSGTATVTATASGYSSGVANVGLSPSGFVINSPSSQGQFTAGDFVTTTLSSPTPLQVSVWQLNSSLLPVTMSQLRGGISAVTQVVSATTTTGTIIGDSLTFNGGDSSQSGIYFQPNLSCLSPCTSVLSVMHTVDYATPASGGQLVATVTMPAAAIRLTQSSVGQNLEIQGAGALDVPAPVDLPVTISSDNPDVLLSASPTDAGSQSLTLTVPAGSGVNSIGFPNYYIQALSGAGSAQLTMSAPGFASSQATVTLAPSGFVIEGPNGIGEDFGVLLANGNLDLTIRAAVLDSNTLLPTVLYQAVRGGLSASVNVTTTAPNVAAIIGAPLQLTSGNSSGTVTLQPQTQGQSTITVGTAVGYSTPANGNAFTVTVN